MRVWKTGNLARMIAIPTGFVFLGSGSLGSFSAAATNSTSSLIAGAFAIGATFVIVRACVLGVWLTSDGAIARTWLRTYRFRQGEVSRCDSESYSGLINRFDEGGTLCMLVFSQSGRLSTPLRSTIAFRKTSRRQAREVAAHFGLSVPGREADRPAHRDEIPDV